MQIADKTIPMSYKIVVNVHTCMQSVQLTENLGHVSAVETIANSKARLLS